MGTAQRRRDVRKNPFGGYMDFEECIEKPWDWRLYRYIKRFLQSHSLNVRCRRQCVVGKDPCFQDRLFDKQEEVIRVTPLDSI